MSEAKKVPATGLDLLREPFPAHQISKLPKPTAAQTDAVKGDFKKGMRCQICGAWHHPDVIHLDYVGHAALTDRLLDADPNWTWDPVANPESSGLPTVPGGMWIRLKVCGVTRLGFGFAGGKMGGDAVKETIGDALRNAAMRFGAALDLWHKGQLHDEESEPKPATPAFVSPVTSALEGVDVTPDMKSKMSRIANSLIDLCNLSTDGEDVDYKIWELIEPIENDEKLYLWQILQPHSRVRSKVKAVSMERAKKDAIARTHAQAA